MIAELNPIQKENQRRGTSDWKLLRPALDREIEGYASKNSINKGEVIEFYVNTAAPDFTISLYRMGWYGGLGARQVGEPISCPGLQQPVPLPDPNTGLVECQWRSSLSLNTEVDWVSGIYIAKLEESNTKKQSYILFVLRDEYRSADILFQLPVTTYQAYNYWGGKSLYEFGSGSNTRWGQVTGTPATKVSFNRPYARSNNPKAAFGMGAGEFFTNVQPVTTHQYPISSAAWDYNMVRWLEKNNYDLNYITNIDTHTNSTLLEKTKIFLSQGHDEYWTYEMRENITRARDRGTHLAFCSSNTMFWQVRLEANYKGEQPDRTLVCYKDTTLDPVKTNRVTINLRDIPGLHSEAALMGVQYKLDPVQGNIRVTNQDHWIFEGSGLKNGDQLKGLLGYEIDGLAESSPENIEVLAASPCQNQDKKAYNKIIGYMLKKPVQFPGRIIGKILQSNKFEKILQVITAVAYGLILYGAWKWLPLPLFLSGLVLLMLLLLIWFIKIINSGKIMAHMTIYEAESGALVFATGSMQWCWGLDDFNVPELRKSRKSLKAEIITKNVFKRMGATSYQP